MPFMSGPDPHDAAGAYAGGISLKTNPLEPGETTPAGYGLRSPGRTHAIPRWVWLVALLAAVVHMAPYWKAADATPDGWTFTANLSASPDYMQYRVWMRQTQSEGPIVSNRFTTEPNSPHLPVALYWGIGRIATITGITPEWIYAWAGAALASAFAVLLYLTVRYFAPHSRAAVWIFGALLVGGGLGGYVKFLQASERAWNNPVIRKLILQPLSAESAGVVFDSYRGNYIVQSLFDTHFLMFWTVTTAAVMMLYLTVTGFTYLRLAGMSLLFGISTFLHVYEGLTLMLITSGALLLCWRKGLPARRALLIWGVCAASAGICLVGVAALYMLSGLPSPTWRGLNVLPSVILMAYPIAWLLIVWGFVRYWLEAGTDGAFLVGWAAGCLTLLVAAPFFPYPDRGTMSLQIPLYLIAGGIYFSKRQRVGAPAVLLLVVLLGSTPAWIGYHWVERTTFNAESAHKWVTVDHEALVGSLRDNAARNDVLVAGEVALRWLGPEYPGLHYAGHFFLTVDYDRKQQRIRSFYETMTPGERLTFLREENVRFFHVDAEDDPDAFALLPGVTPLEVRPIGTIFEFDRDAAAVAALR